MAEVNWQRSISVLMVCYLASCNSFSLPDFPGIDRSDDTVTGMNIQNPTPKMQCYDNGIYYIGRIPNPQSCTEFYICAPSGSSNGTEQQVIYCPVGHDGRRLVYDFRQCGSDRGCNYKDEAECYDDSNPNHLQDFYKCAQPYVPN